jgi:very-short-patch-repair endonuclease
MAHSNTFKALSKACVYKKPKKKKSEKKPKNRLIRYAERLNDNLPKSEHWFDELFKSHSLYPLFLKNQIIDKYIVDVLYIDKKIVIEIDGSYHDQEHQIAKDFIKDMKLKKKGYTVIRVKAYDIDSYNNCITILESLCC